MDVASRNEKQTGATKTDRRTNHCFKGENAGCIVSLSEGANFVDIREKPGSTAVHVKKSEKSSADKESLPFPLV